MSVVIIGGHDRMVCQYKKVCKSFNCKAKVFTQMSATLSKQIGNPDLIVLWNSSLDEVYQLKELDALPAVKSKQVFAMNPAFYYDPHTVKFLLFAKQLRNWCYPSAYSTEQLNKEVQNDIMQLYQKPDLYKKNAI